MLKASSWKKIQPKTLILQLLLILLIATATGITDLGYALIFSVLRGWEMIELVGETQSSYPTTAVSNSNTRTGLGGIKQYGITMWANRNSIPLGDITNWYTEFSLSVSTT